MGQNESDSGVSRRRILLGILGGAVAIAGAAGGLVVYKDQRWVETEPYERVGGHASVAVVVYSRSGNTLLAAKEVARELRADLLTIEAPAYPRTIGGQQQASADADAEATETEIRHDPIDLGKYSRVILCSPVWWYRPAVPMWAFVGSSEFGGASVSLFLTGNSRYEDEKIAPFRELVESRGGRFESTHFVARGRVLWQLSREELKAAAQEIAQELRGAAGAP